MALTYVKVLCVLLLTTVHVTPANIDFIIFPSQQVVGVGQQAVFRCQHQTASAIGWRVNDTDVNDSNPPPGMIRGMTMNGSRIVRTLTILANSTYIYNDTEVVCIAFGSMNDETIPVKVLIQGPLNMVIKVKRNFSTTTWEPPFSLDLTGVDPDIVYCVEVYSITCGVDDLVVGDCNVTEAHYVDNRLQQGHIYRITITPRSNIQNTINGTKLIREEMFTSLTDPKISIMFTRRESTNVFIVIELRNDGTRVDRIQPDSYSIFLSSIDGVEDLSNILVLVTYVPNTDAVNLNVSRPLPSRRLWNYQILALDCHENPVTNSLELSTHDFQNVTVSPSNPGTINVTGNFIPGSVAIGVLVIVYMPHNDTNIHYHFIPRSGAVNGLPGGQYNVSVFVVEDNGLPFKRCATIPRNISISNGSTAQLSFEYELQSTSTGVCINCTFLDNSSTDCVAVVHQRISQLSSSGLMNIESSHKFTRSGDTAHGCIEGVNLELYQIGMIGSHGRITMNSIKIDHEWYVIVSSIGAVLLLTVTVVLLTLVTRKYYAFKKFNIQGKGHQQEEHIDMQICGAYEITKPLSHPHQRRLSMKDNPAYDSIHQGRI